jgi:hypothetical protein
LAAQAGKTRLPGDGRFVPAGCANYPGRRETPRPGVAGRTEETAYRAIINQRIMLTTVGRQGWVRVGRVGGPAAAVGSERGLGQQPLQTIPHQGCQGGAAQCRPAISLAQQLRVYLRA